MKEYLVYVGFIVAARSEKEAKGLAMKKIRSAYKLDDSELNDTFSFDLEEFDDQFDEDDKVGVDFFNDTTYDCL